MTPTSAVRRVVSARIPTRWGDFEILVVNDDGTMTRVPDLIGFCKRHGLVMVTVAEVARYRLDTEYEELLWASGAAALCF